MKKIFQIVWLGSLSLLVLACGQEVSREKIQELPPFDEAYYQRILAVVNEELETYPEYADAYFKKGEVLEKLRNPENAIINYKKAIKLDSTNATYYKRLARLFASENKLKRAEETALKAAQFGNQNAGLYQLIAYIHEQKGEYNLALNQINRAIENSPSNSDFIFTKGKLYLQQRDTLKAKEFLLANSDRLKGEAAVFQAFADIYTFEKKYPEALAYMDSSLALMKESRLPLMVKKADILQKSGDMSGAKKLLNSYLKQDSLNFALTFKVAELHYASYGYDSALYFLNKAVLLEGQKKEAFWLMGKTYDRKRMYYSAREQFENALLIDTSYQEARVSLDELNKKLAYMYRAKQAAQESSSLPQAETVKPKTQNK